MAFEKYWKKVGKLSPHIGALYIASKVVFGAGVGMLLASFFGFNQLIALIVTVIGILMMLPAERKIISGN